MALDNNVLTATPDGARQRFVFDGLTWSNYLALRKAWGEHARYRLTYTRGRLELMSPSRRHELVNRHLGSLLDYLFAEFGILAIPNGSFTMDREDLDQSLESDDSYYIANAKAVEGRVELDMEKDPPPDLCLEIDVTNRSLSRLPVYAQLGVPEVWRWERQRFVVYVLQPDRSYVAVRKSIHAIRGFDPQSLVKFIEIGISKNPPTMMKRFRREVARWKAARQGKKK